MLISIVVPMYNEGGNVLAFVDRVKPILESLNYSFEVLLVDDGSSDNTWSKIHDASENNDIVSGVKLSRNFGHQGALLAGLNTAKGDAVISMDGDLQHPPELIPILISKWESGDKVVTTCRRDNKETSWFKKATSKYFYKVFSAMSETTIDPGSSDFRLLDRCALDTLLSLNYGQPFLRGAVNTIGYKAGVVEYDVENRHSGESKYNFKKMISFARHGLISHSTFPLRLGIYLGMLMGLVSVLEIIYVLIVFVMGNTVPGWASSTIITSLLFSVVFTILGVMGLYLEDMHRLLRKKPHFIVEKSRSEKS